MNRIKIEGSSNIAEIGYDHGVMTLEIKFHSGGIYKYWPITQEGFEGLLKAPSKGKYFFEKIRGNPKINFQKVEEIQS